MSGQIRLTSTFTSLNGVTATGAGKAFNPQTSSVTAAVRGITTATVQIQGSMDGSNYLSEQAALTADGRVAIDTPWKYLRGNVTAYTSGTIFVDFLE